MDAQVLSLYPQYFFAPLQFDKQMEEVMVPNPAGCDIFKPLFYHFGDSSSSCAKFQQAE
jgi:hypothetical protein